MKRLFGALIIPILLVLWGGAGILEEPAKFAILIGVYIFIYMIITTFLINYTLNLINSEDCLPARFAIKTFLSVGITLVIYAGVVDSLGL